MNTILAINALMALITTATNALTAAGAVSALIAKAKAEGRDISSLELDELLAEDEKAKVALQKAINEAE